jgi:phosphoribosylglycinamide formyltransferase 1
VLAQREVPIRPDDDEERLHERIKTVERELLVETVARWATASPLDRTRPRDATDTRTQPRENAR